MKSSVGWRGASEWRSRRPSGFSISNAFEDAGAEEVAPVEDRGAGRVAVDAHQAIAGLDADRTGLRRDLGDAPGIAREAFEEEGRPEVPVLATDPQPDAGRQCEQRPEEGDARRGATQAHGGRGIHLAPAGALGRKGTNPARPLSKEPAGAGIGPDQGCVGAGGGVRRSE